MKLHKGEDLRQINFRKGEWVDSIEVLTKFGTYSGGGKGGSTNVNLHIYVESILVVEYGKYVNNLILT